MKYLLDTNVISELVTKQPDERVTAWIDGIDDQLVYLSVITIGEITRGNEKLPNSHRKSRLKNRLNEELLIKFDGKILGTDLATILTWGRSLLNWKAGVVRFQPSIPSWLPPPCIMIWI